MATVHNRNAVILLNGSAIQTSLNEFSAEMGAEMLDETTFGDSTRINKGGLTTATISGSGFAESGADLIETLIAANVGTDDCIVSVYPDAVTDGSTTTGRGFAMKGVIDELTVGGTVGTLLALTFAIQGRGIEA